MHANRIQHLIPADLAADSTSGGFVPCPAAVLSHLTAEQQSAVAEIYKIARERVLGRRQSPAQAWWPPVRFSQN